MRARNIHTHWRKRSTHLKAHPYIPSLWIISLCCGCSHPLYSALVHIQLAIVYANKWIFIANNIYSVTSCTRTYTPLTQRTYIRRRRYHSRDRTPGSKDTNVLWQLYNIWNILGASLLWVRTYIDDMRCEESPGAYI